MLDYFKSQLAEREKANGQITFDDDIDDTSVVVECAHLFQEMDDLSVEGTDSTADRPVAVDIPLEDDLELETIELDVADGRITDIPMDANVQEQYTDMKTFEDFYQEAMIDTMRLPRESEESFESRVMEAAVKKEKVYFDSAEKKGLFGTKKIKLQDQKIPNVVKLKCDEKGKNTKVALIRWELMGIIHTKISENMFDALTKFVDNNQFIRVCNDMISYIKNKYPKETKEADDIWSLLGSPILYVPKQKSRFCVYVDFGKTFFTREHELQWAWYSKIKEDDANDVRVTRVRIPNHAGRNMYCWSKNEWFHECARLEANKKPLNRFAEDQTYYQEAIDFGSTDGDDDTSKMNVTPADEGTDLAPDTNEPSNDNATDVNVDVNPSDDNGDNASNTDKKDALPVDTNDVSDDIAQKVSDTTTDDTSSIDGDVDTSLDGSLDNIDGDNTSDVDGKIDELNDMGNTDASVDDTAEKIDFDNMTMDDLIMQGTERLKGMTMAQLKEFMNGNAAANGDMDNLTQESFFLTKKNINKEMSDQLRVVSGILNNTELKFADLVNEFRKEGKKLNKVLSKAGKSKKVYTAEDMENINKLNTVVVQLMNVFKPDISDNEAIMVKRLIKEFVSRAVVVGDIIERVAGDKNKSSTDKPADDK